MNTTVSGTDDHERHHASPITASSASSSVTTSNQPIIYTTAQLHESATINDSINQSINSTSIHQFYNSASTRLRSLTFSIPFDNESRVKTRLRRYLRGRLQHTKDILLHIYIWLTDNTGTRKRHRTAQNLGNEKVVSSISAARQS